MNFLDDQIDYKVEKEEIILKSLDLRGMVASFLVDLIVVGVADKEGQVLGGVGGYLIPKSLLLLKNDEVAIFKIGQKYSDYNLQQRFKCGS